jgi:hypothetical protein
VKTKAFHLKVVCAFIEFTSYNDGYKQGHIIGATLNVFPKVSRQKSVTNLIVVWIIKISKQ